MVSLGLELGRGFVRDVGLGSGLVRGFVRALVSVFLALELGRGLA